MSRESVAKQLHLVFGDAHMRDVVVEPDAVGATPAH